MLCDIALFGAVDDQSLTGKPLCHEELQEDRLVKTKIDKVRREA